MILFILFAVNFCVCGTSFPLTEVSQGILKGQFLKTYNNRTFSSFTAIPYAEPPVGDLRFELARPAKKWNGTLDATNPHPVCPQMHFIVKGSKPEGDEDCLYLNVYTPLVFIEFSLCNILVM
ncbi:hypothetical protein ILUMI_19439 [Ignelater luminosus]|uniref:Carboxylesterase type B domain-containing protein n=1 Tax=Ignelater luminosus TaxID=2038154 RepID=A0A8K0CG74_IGNLU|nr:hypothetical protein ILUMI_19439 [Ignelater luminosus]